MSRVLLDGCQRIHDFELCQRQIKGKRSSRQCSPRVRVHLRNESINKEEEQEEKQKVPLSRKQLRVENNLPANAPTRPRRDMLI